MSWEDVVEMLYPNLSKEELEEELTDRIPDWFSGGDSPCVTIKILKSTRRKQNENRRNVFKS